MFRFLSVLCSLVLFIQISMPVNAARGKQVSEPTNNAQPAPADTLKQETIQNAIGVVSIDSIRNLTLSNSLPKPDDVRNRKDTLLVVAVGDIMLGSIVPNNSYLPPEGDCSPLLQEVKPYLADGDIVFCNLEGAFSDTKVGAKNCTNSTTCFTFGMPSSFVNCFIDAGFNLLSVANNHSGDFGEAGKNNTAKVLDDNNLHWAGFTSHPYTVFEKDGVKYGFCAFAPNRGTVQITDLDNARQIVEDLKKKEKCDIVIVSFHGGAEGRSHQHVTRKSETFLGQNRGNVYEFAHTVVDAGADLVLGHGPHVTRAVEIYNGKFIAYSMGNFATYSNINIKAENGLAPIIRAKIDAKSGNVLSAEIISTYQIKPPNKGPHIDPDKRVLKLIQKLTQEDIYDNAPIIGDDGIVLPRNNK